jgi:hypothetical protein
MHIFQLYLPALPAIGFVSIWWHAKPKAQRKFAYSIAPGFSLYPENACHHG